MNRKDEKWDTKPVHCAWTAQVMADLTAHQPRQIPLKYHHLWTVTVAVTQAAPPHHSYHTNVLPQPGLPIWWHAGWYISVKDFSQWNMAVNSGERRSASVTPYGTACSHSKIKSHSVPEVLIITRYWIIIQESIFFFYLLWRINTLKTFIHWDLI